MKLLWTTFLITAFFISVPAWGADEFQQFWYDGNAELSVYDLRESRYNEVREGKRIMIFVTEPLRRSTLVKPDSRLPEEQRFDVLKLNDVRAFTTGIYDYSIMTSVFSVVKAYEGVPAMGAVKVSFGGQEWCGNVFEIMKRTGEGIHTKLYSYFESDGEPETVFPLTDKVIFEDNLWILVRELKGPFIEDGASKKFRLIPSAWQRRKRHVPISMETVTVSKKDGGRVSTPAGRFDCCEFTWVYGEKTTRVRVERDWPRKIVSWIEADGTTGKLVESTRKPYWLLHDTKDRHLRRKLRIE